MRVRLLFSLAAGSLHIDVYWSLGTRAVASHPHPRACGVGAGRQADPAALPTIPFAAWLQDRAAIGAQPAHHTSALHLLNGVCAMCMHIVHKSCKAHSI